MWGATMADAFVASSIFLFVEGQGDKCGLMEKCCVGGKSIQWGGRVPQLDVGDAEGVGGWTGIGVFARPE